MKWRPGQKKSLSCWQMHRVTRMRISGIIELFPQREAREAVVNKTLCTKASAENRAQNSWMLSSGDASFSEHQLTKSLPVPWAEECFIAYKWSPKALRQPGQGHLVRQLLTQGWGPRILSPGPALTYSDQLWELCLPATSGRGKKIHGVMALLWVWHGIRGLSNIPSAIGVLDPRLAHLISRLLSPVLD